MRDQETILYHGSQTIVELPEIRPSRFYKDFHLGFYCTLLFKQAKRWAIRFSGQGKISEYLYRPDSSLQILKFPEMTEEWLDFVVSCRTGVPHFYDIVEGPMADDTIFNYVQNFVDGKISRSAFWELVKFKHPTHQICFHTPLSLTKLQFLKGYSVTDEE